MTILLLAAVVFAGRTVQRAHVGWRDSQGASLVVGPGDACRTQPRFARNLGLSDRAGFTTGLRGYVGLAIVDPQGEAGQERVYQHPSWSAAGHLGATTSDRFGNLYVAPLPRDDLALNPPAEQNRIYRVDTESQEMRLLMELPPGLPPTEIDPIGVMGLAYDCDTDSLYATSLAGSTAEVEVGRVFQIDLRRGEVVAQIDNLDAAGIAVFNAVDGKKLFLGSARSPVLLSVDLDERGRFQGRPRPVIDLSGRTKGGRTTVYRIRFPERRKMELMLTDMHAMDGTAQQPGQDILTYEYVESSNQWRPLE